MNTEVVKTTEQTVVTLPAEAPPSIMSSQPDKKPKVEISFVQRELNRDMQKLIKGSKYESVIRQRKNLSLIEPIKEKDEDEK